MRNKVMRIRRSARIDGEGKAGDDDYDTWNNDSNRERN
jgi:hypothetical protein